MLYKINLRNFKSHKELDIDLSKINIFIGANNSGKSSIFQAMQLMKQNLKFKNQFLIPLISNDDSENEANLIDVGDFEDVVRKNTKELEIGFEGDFETEEEILNENDIKKISVKYSVIFRENNLIHSEGVIDAGENKFSWPNSVMWSGANKIKPLFGQNVQCGFKKSPNFASKKEKELESSLFEINQDAISNFLRRQSFVSGSRGFERKGYPQTKSNKSSIDIESLSFENRSIAISNFFTRDRMLEDAVSEVTKEYLGFAVVFEIDENGKVILKSKQSKDLSPIISEGLGSQQLLSIFLPLAIPHLKTFFIEEPEAHLHPKLQSDVTEKIVDICLGENKQVIMSTHSEHVLQKVLSLINSKKLKQEDVRVYYVEKEEGISKVTKQEPDEFGRLPNGLPGFFEHNLDEIENYLKQMSERL